MQAKQFACSGEHNKKAPLLVLFYYARWKLQLTNTNWEEVFPYPSVSLMQIRQLLAIT